MGSAQCWPRAGRTALVYDPAGTDGEVELNGASQTTVEVLSGNVLANWGPTSDDLRLDYVHGGLLEVLVSGGGRPALLLLIAGTNTAEEFAARGAFSGRPGGPFAPTIPPGAPGPRAGARGTHLEALLNAVSLSVPYPDLSSTFNNTGVTDNSDPEPYSGFIGFDGIGTSYSAQGLAVDGITPGATLSADSLSFTWPSAAVATPDNTMAEGQVITLTGSGTRLGFLAAANNSPESGTGAIYYTDGTTQSFTLDVGNFWYPAGTNGNPDNVTVASVNYANYPRGSSGHTVYVFEQSVPLEAGKAVEAVALPPLGSVAGYNPALHVFAMSIGG